MKRRAFIGIAVTSAAGVALSTLAGERPQTPWAMLAAPHLLELLHDPALVHDLGQRYRVLTPAEDGTQLLADAILADLGPAAPADLESHVNDLVRRDFAAGRTVSLKGWILAVTEARQCALYSLLAP